MLTGGDLTLQRPTMRLGVRAEPGWAPTLPPQDPSRTPCSCTHATELRAALDNGLPTMPSHAGLNNFVAHATHVTHVVLDTHGQARDGGPAHLAQRE